MSIVLVNASPRKNKNCFQIKEIIKNMLAQKNIEYEIVNIWDMNISYCNACGYCDKTGYCHIKDDMTPLYSKIDSSDGTIVISPVYFDCVPAKLKTVVDRTQAFYASKYVLNKPTIDRNKRRIGMYIAIGGSEPYESQFQGGNIVMDFFFKCINTQLLYKCSMFNSDKKSVKDNMDFMNKINNSVNQFVENLSSR